MPDPLLELKDVSVYYGKVRATQGICLQVNPAEVVAIIGSNGAGKTSTLRTVSRVARSSGDIRFRGRSIAHLAAPDVAALGLIHVPEGNGVLRQLTVLENLQFGAYLRRDRSQIKNDLQSVFEKFPRLLERRATKADLLSGGERSMLGIGRALMARPRLLMLDEPTLGLSPLLCKQVEATIKGLRAGGEIAMLLVSQNARFALRSSDRTYVFEKGRIVAQGASAALADDSAIRLAYFGA
jgi:branched-chain amino acid transport system ATP-binding protein